MKHFDLAEARWTLEPTDNLKKVPAPVLDAGPVPATVPGCVQTDLMAAGLLDDPYLHDNEQRQLWIGETSWRYTATFDLPSDVDGTRVQLACDGLDTIATLTLNGSAIGTSDNMHVAKRFDVKQALKPGQNVLVIDFAAPVPHARAQEKLYPDLPRQGGIAGVRHAHNLVRKMACNYGWDWGPIVATCGVWRPIRIEAWDTARLAEVRPLISSASDQSATVEVVVKVEGEAQPTVRLSGHGFDETRDGSPTFTVPSPQLWWPLGHGDQPLYDLTVTLPDGQSWHRRIGLRTTELDTSPDDAPYGDPVPDAQGERMVLKVNGKAIYAKGANWIPDDCFPHRVTRDRYRHQVKMAADANMNMLRVWGGGIFESRDFYEACDEMGVMVWQDFLFACACYPEADEYKVKVEEEVRYNVARLMPHPSIVLWNGNNECIWGTYDWGDEWIEIRESGRDWGLSYWLDLLPKLVKELDPHRPYWPASPYSGNMERHPNLNEYGNRHMWDVWHGAGQYRNYLGHYPRMATEFGYHGPPTWAVLSEAIPPEERHWHSVVMLMHNKNGRDGQVQTRERIQDDFVLPENDFDSFCYLAQVMQARRSRWASSGSARCTRGTPRLSFGSSTTAGPSAVGRASTPAAVASRSTSRADDSSPIGSSPSSRNAPAKPKMPTTRWPSTSSTTRTKPGPATACSSRSTSPASRWPSTRSR